MLLTVTSEPMVSTTRCTTGRTCCALALRTRLLATGHGQEARAVGGRGRARAAHAAFPLRHTAPALGTDAGVRKRPSPVAPDGVGWPGASQPPAPSDPGVTVSRHRALLIGPSTCGPRASG